MAFKFENLKVWQSSVELSGQISELIEKFPKKELFILKSQMQRASDSISLNIAEGSTGQTNPEFRRFLGMAIRSSIEVVSCFYLAKRRNLVTEQEFDHFYNYLSELVKSTQALRNSIR